MANDVVSMLDITAPEAVDIVIRADGRVIWVNIDGLCRLRVCRVTKLTIEDQRTLTDDQAVNPDGTTYDP